MPNTGEQAIAAARTQSANGPKFGAGQCLLRCRLAFGVDAIVHDASLSWAQSKTQHKTTKTTGIPRGVPVYWTGGSHGFGHIAISTGDGMCWSTDIRRVGMFDKVPISEIHDKWGLTFVGWSEELNGVRVWSPPAKPQPAKPVVKTPAKPAPATAGGLRVDGIDLSHHNAVTQAGLNAAANLGAKYAYLKATEGATVKDAAYATRRGMVRKAGMVVGAYHFARPDADGKDGAAEAKFFLAAAKPLPGDMRPVLDLEDAGHLSKAALTAWVGAWVGVVKAATGVLPIVYTPFDLADNFDCMLWVARYSDANAAPIVPKPWTRWRMRQFSDGKFGKPNSIAGMKVDLNTLHDGENLDWLRIPVKPAPEPTPTPTPIPKPIPVPIPKPAVTPEPTSFVHGHFNTQHTDTSALGTPQLRAVIKASDLLGLNEVESVWQRLVVATSPKFSAYPLTGAASADPIMWRKSRFDLISKASTKAYSGEAHVTPSAYVNEVTLRDKVTGKVVTRINAHPPAHIESGGKARVYTKAELPKYAHQLERAQAIFTLIRDRIVANAAQGAVIFGADTNVDALAETRLPAAKRVPWFPLSLLGAVAKTVTPSGGSLGSRAVDWVMTSGPITSLHAWYGEQGASDHKPVFNEFDL